MSDLVALMLGWELNIPEKALAILDKGIAANPDRWRLYYLRGFTHMFFNKDLEHAHADFLQASKLPHADPIAARLAAKTLVAGSSPQDAIEFLAEMIRGTKDPATREMLEKRLRESIYERDLRALEKAVGIFKEAQGRAPAEIQELLSAGIINRLPKDPAGGSYYYDSESGEVKSTSDMKRPRVFHPFS